MTDIDVYGYLRKNATDGRISISIQAIADEFSLSLTAVRAELRRLSKYGYITAIKRKDRDGADLPNEYILTGVVPEDASSPLVMSVKTIYCKFVAERTGKPVSPRYAFNGYTNMFCKIAELCKKEHFDPHVYILSCFHSFPANWCRKKFHVPYPPPYVIASRKNAVERYAALQRYIAQHETPNQLARDYNDQILDSYYVWQRLEIGEDVRALAVLVNNGTVLPEFFLAMQFVKERDHKLIRPEILNRATDAKVNNVKCILARR